MPPAGVEFLLLPVFPSPVNNYSELFGKLFGKNLLIPLIRFASPSRRQPQGPGESSQKARKSFAQAGLGDGDERNRTADLLVANQSLSQLSYVPAWSVKRIRRGFPQRLCPVAWKVRNRPSARLPSEMLPSENGPGRSRTYDLALIRGAL